MHPVLPPDAQNHPHASYLRELSVYEVCSKVNIRALFDGRFRTSEIWRPENVAENLPLQTATERNTRKSVARWRDRVRLDERQARRARVDSRAEVGMLSQD